jgi:hypothetical protein
MVTTRIGIQVTYDVVTDIKGVRTNKLSSGSGLPKWDGLKLRYDKVKWVNTGAIVQT